jgi:hypothetical protein
LLKSALLHRSFPMPCESSRIRTIAVRLQSRLNETALRLLAFSYLGFYSDFQNLRRSTSAEAALKFG